MDIKQYEVQSMSEVHYVLSCTLFDTGQIIIVNI